jgi:hypothetical protein
LYGWSAKAQSHHVSSIFLSETTVLEGAGANVLATIVQISLPQRVTLSSIIGDTIEMAVNNDILSLVCFLYQELDFYSKKYYNKN